MLIKLEKELGISRNQIIREEAEMIIQDQLSQTAWSDHFLFYGGTVLRLAYDSPRFSEYIDLLEIKEVPFPIFQNFIKSIDQKYEFLKLAGIITRSLPSISPGRQRLKPLWHLPERCFFQNAGNIFRLKI